MGVPKIIKEASASITFGYGTNVGTLKDFLSDIPGDAKVSIIHYEGDQREPTMTVLKCQWEIGS